VEKALLALKSARSLFLPTVSFQGGYQIGEGGRSIDLPIGDLLNPVYRTLNELTGNPGKFGTLGNVDQDFLPFNFHDLKVRTTVPILQTDLRYNRELESIRSDLQATELERYKAELTRQVRITYFQYLAAGQAVAVHRSALQLAEEGRRTNERLLAHGKGLPSYVLRSASEIEGIRARIHEAEKNAENVRLYFNFLLNRDPGAAIDTAFNGAAALQEAARLLLPTPDVSGRPELKALKSAEALQHTAVRMQERFRTPRISGFLDLGTQAQGFKFNRRSRYYFAGLQLDVPLFTGRRHLMGIRQARLSAEQSRLERESASRQLATTAAQARNALATAWEQYRSSGAQLASARSYHQLIDRGYREGVNTFIEQVDARNLLTSAELQQRLHEFGVLIAAAQLQFETTSTHP
ncbi:MAG TPA: TolC family protein, partial [Chitinophagaceae bacterium]|nr:TolC family protein [Chitinophagaceae bacterium]